MGTDFVRKSCLKTIHSTVFSLVTVCPCEQFVLENCHGASVYSNKSQYEGLEKPGIVSTISGLQGKWLNHSATVASK